MSFLTQGTIAQWVRSKLLLSSNQTQCSVPAGIFKTKDAMIMATAFGPEVTFIHPPRPADKLEPRQDGMDRHWPFQSRLKLMHKSKR